MTIEFDEFSKKSLGGTEIIKYGLQDRLPRELLNKFQIVCDRIDNLDKNKIRLFWVHLSPIQTEEMLKWMKVDNYNPLSNGGWKKFHKIIFISYLQMEEWVKHYNIPYSHCVVIKYALEPIELQEKPKDKIVLVHHSNPQRGLPILVNVFEKLAEEYPNIELKVHSSWKIYGLNNWEEDYKNSDLYQRLEKHPKIHNIGYLPNEELKKSLASSHIFAYPSIWKETFCLSLLEAMSAGLLCVHSSLGALPETASNWTMMYPFDEDKKVHEERFYHELKKAIETVNNKERQEHLKKQKEYVDYLFNWERRTQEWVEFLKSMLNTSIFYQ
jgi:glycosyltransferase involved in cell wall biosynthesis